MTLQRPGAPPTERSSRPDAWSRIVALADTRAAYLLLAVLAYVPVLLTKPGVVSDDTKTYLYLDPGKWLRSATSMWDPSVALGSVTHQKIGYLLPMGPYYWATAALHVPTWVAQRLWLGTILFAAAAGTAHLCTRLGVHGPARVVAGTAYAFTPYVLQYAGRISVLLLPFAGLPWLLALIVGATRTRGWTYPALFALTVAVVGAINASSLVYVGIAPLLWLAYAVFVTGEVDGRRAWGVLARTGLLTIGASLWWMAGLAVEGAYGINILKYTESVQATASATSPAEVVRGLGYWYFYGADRLGLWTAAVQEFTEKVWILALTYLMPVAAFAAAAVTRWADRAFFVLLLVVGLALSVASFPYDHPTPFGALVKAVMNHTTVGSALRSTDRATPMVILSLAVLLGAGVAALVRRRRRAGVVVALVLGILLIAADAPLLAGRSVIRQFSQPAVLPAYTASAAAHLNAVHPGTRVYGLPGNDFAAYRYGDTVDPVWPALLDRPFVTREQLIQGSQATADLLYALDNPLQQGTADPAALAPIARLMSVGDVLVQYDQAYERYGVARPAAVAAYLTPTPSGLGAPIPFGAPVVNTSTVPMEDETYYRLPTPAPIAPLVVYPVPGTRPVFRAEPARQALVVDGDGAGLVQAAALGRLDGDPTVFYAPTLLADPALARQALAPGAQLVVTDSNRKRAFEWNTLFENTGYTQTAAEHQSAFEANWPGIDLFPGAPVTSRTTTVLTGDVAAVTASAYGTANSLRPEFRPANALDGDLSTAWETEGNADGPVEGQWWQVTLGHPATADVVTLTQPQSSATFPAGTNRWITRATLTFDGGHPVTVDLGASSRSSSGQHIAFPARRFTTLRVRIDKTNLSDQKTVPPGSSLVGLAEVGIDDVRAGQVVQLPTDLLHAMGSSSAADRLTMILTRDRVAPVPPRQDPETTLVRQFSLPTTRTFGLSGTARLSTTADDATVGRLAGLGAPAVTAAGTTGSGAQVVGATSSSRLPGDTGASAWATLDGDPATAWNPGLGPQAMTDPWLSYTFDRPVTLDHLDLVVAADASHSVPRALQVTGDSGTHTVPLAAVPTTGPGGRATIHVSFPPVTGSHLRITFSAVAVRAAPSYETSLVTALPLAVAEVGLPGVARAVPPAAIPAPCRADLLAVDGTPVSVSVSGPGSDALGGQGLQVALCGPDAGGLVLGRGTHLLTAADGASTGIDLDQLVLDSPPEGAVAPPAAAPSSPATVQVLSQDATSAHLRVTPSGPSGGPFLLVMGQSLNAGWHATVAGGPDLGPPVLVDGFANGWRVGSGVLAGRPGSFDVTIRFAPQAPVDVAVLLSAATLLLCLLLVAVAVVRDRRRVRAGDATVDATGDATGGSRGAAGADVDPLLVLPFGAGDAVGRAPAAAGTAVAAALVAGALSWVIGGWLAGVAVGAGIVLALRWRRGRGLLGAAGFVFLAATALDVVGIEAIDHLAANSGWPSRFDVAPQLAWAGVLLLTADVALEVIGRVRGRHNPG
ncbi:MAG TPA: alpha-(1-_3)-arabinofuranosyltransferase family protein [Acidimicrobiales bacterium]|nr:alpha-(1->3)-arabinofuranosyltransferase family protein [Acidimicrobiales bacterium]